MSSYRNSIIEEAIRFIDEHKSSYTPELVADFFLNHPQTVASENLRDAVACWCQTCPVEVQQALHEWPNIGIHHFDHPFEEPEARMERLLNQTP